MQKMLMSHLQMLGVLGIFKAKGTRVFNDVASQPGAVAGGSITGLLPIKCVLQSQLYGPFLLTMALPLVATACSVLLMIPTALIEHARRRKRVDAVPPVFKGKINIPRCVAMHRLLRDPMTDADVAEWRGDFYPRKRIAGVCVFVLYAL